MSNNPLTEQIAQDGESILRDLIADVDVLKARELSGQNISSRVYKSTVTPILDITLTSLTYNTIRWNYGGCFNIANPTRLTCVQAGIHLVGGSIKWTLNNTGRRYVGVLLNNVVSICENEIQAVQNSTTSVSFSTIYDLVIGDYIELIVFQSSGGVLNLLNRVEMSQEFMISRIG